MSTFERIYAIVRRIPFGCVATYGQVARMAGNPRMSRIVGCAMHVAPEGVPCHRVVNRAGGLCDAFQPMGKESHRMLLEMESVPFLPDGRVDLDRCRWTEERMDLMEMDSLCPEERRGAALLREVFEDYLRILGEKMVGFFVHGSLTMGCFRWARGDLDFLVAVSAPLSQPEKVALVESLLRRTPDAPPKGFEMSVVLASACREFCHPAPYELHFSNGHLERARANLEKYCREMHGLDADLAAHFAMIRARGWSWLGDAQSMIAPVPQEALADSIRGDVADADPAENPAYTALNCCRAVAMVEQNQMLSKEEGARWALECFPEDYRPTIERALETYVCAAPPPDAGAVAVLRDYVLDRVGWR